ncbi:MULTISPECIES: phosphatase PAP2 family protein [unclassified Gilliamella]|uniref:acid phosphatase n=1 Tax=unclassified Gilliamella TaxID=2685620 RepID=UPI0013090816|nr:MULTISPECIES: phosphatase PAP2 family protein [unclassified Gilliamella]MWP48218.1 phosphatase PAP2 family protein [Gilliamella sp. Lep-s35]MWP68138.1 phosphatase PAP2 family protein [Gilliamella sp. Lep-s5]MWP76358.1 phosphatase PAP2 family protein [Gilliamella sp. Lep-s21]
MQKIFVNSIIISVLISANIYASNIKDVTTDPNDFFLKEEQAPNSLLLLPPPPSFNSIDFLRDKAMYDWGKSVRNTERGKQAYLDADSSKDNITKQFSHSFGFEISDKKTPEIYKLVTTMKEDAGDLATRSAKKYYNRIRPFSFFNESTCRPEDEKMLSTNGSYPSGHTTMGFAISLVLAEINPARQNEILKRGYEIGESRVICGYHWQSDVDAARVMAAAVVAQLHANAEFNRQLTKAKAEFSYLK